MPKEVSKSVLQIKNGEYLLEIRGNAVATTYKKESALDITEWKWEQVEYIVSNLYKVGYTKCKIVEVKIADVETEEIKNEVSEIE